MMTMRLDALDNNLIRSDIHPEIESRLRAIENQEFHSRVAALEEKMAAIPAQIKQTAEAAESAAHYAEYIKRLVIRGPVAGSLIRNLAGVGGIASITTGLWIYSPATSLTVVGAICLGLVVLGTILRRPNQKQETNR
jgi:hypothetical protein